MEIKVKVSDSQRDWIENQLNNYKNALTREEQRHKDEISNIKKKIVDYENFWSTNEIQVEDGALGYQRRQNINRDICHETKLLWMKSDKININTLKKETLWVCRYCKQPAMIKYIATGHDHTDYSYDICDCEGAAKTGKPYHELT